MIPHMLKDFLAVLAVGVLLYLSAYAGDALRK